jgi:hypothetical protein
VPPTAPRARDSTPRHRQPLRGALLYARACSGPLLVCLLALSLSGPPSMHLAVLLLMLLSARSSALAALLLLSAAAGLGALYSRGLRLVVRADGVGQFGLALVRCAGEGARGEEAGGALSWFFVFVLVPCLCVGGLAPQFSPNRGRGTPPKPGSPTRPLSSPH